MARAAQDVTCRYEGDPDRLSSPVAHPASRVVQEGLTNALRLAPGAAVRIVIRVEEAGTTGSGGWSVEARLPLTP